MTRDTIARRPSTTSNRSRTAYRIDRYNRERRSVLTIGTVIDSWLEAAPRSPRLVRWRPVTARGVSLTPCATLGAAIELLEVAYGQALTADMGALGFKPAESQEPGSTPGSRAVSGRPAVKQAAPPRQAQTTGERPAPSTPTLDSLRGRALGLPAVKQ